MRTGIFFYYEGTFKRTYRYVLLALENACREVEALRKKGEGKKPRRIKKEKLINTKIRVKSYFSAMACTDSTRTETVRGMYIKCVYVCMYACVYIYMNIIYKYMYA